MGVKNAFFGKPAPVPEYDLVYAGYERSGLLHTIRQFANMGYGILVIGAFSKAFRQSLAGQKRVVFAGRLSQEEIPALFRICRMGLNLTPDVYPYQFQTSTKIIEYCAAGLGVVSNRYSWAEDFCTIRNARFLWLDQATSNKVIDQFNFVVPNVADLEWNRLLKKAGFADFIRTLASPNLSNR
jgi:hypothetical protein